MYLLVVCVCAGWPKPGLFYNFVTPCRPMWWRRKASHNQIVQYYLRPKIGKLHVTMFKYSLHKFSENAAWLNFLSSQLHFFPAFKLFHKLLDATISAIGKWALICDVIPVCLSRSVNYRCLMPMTHVPEVGAENRYQKTGAGFWRVWRDIWYRIFPVPVFGNQ